MECPGLNGLWKYCPPFSSGMTENEIRFFATIGAFIIVGLILGVALLTICINKLIH